MGLRIQLDDGRLIEVPREIESAGGAVLEAWERDARQNAARKDDEDE